MSQASIRNALEAAFAAIQPAIDIVHENAAYDPVADRPYAELYLLFATPGNPTIGDAFYQEIGIFQINLQYPPLVGTLAAATQAQLIRDTFPRGATFADGSVTVMIDRTPEIGPGRVEAGCWMVPIKIRWHADINR